MKKAAFGIVVCFAAISLSVAMWAGEVSGTSGKMGEKPSGETFSLVESTATVQYLDYNTRMATLQADNGDTLTFRVSNEVKNLDQVKVGDKVKFQYYESVAWEVKKAGETSPGIVKAETVKRSGAEQLPAKLEATQTTVVTTIEAIDRQNQTVTLKGPAGKLVVVKARHPENLEKVKEGDHVMITYTEALAVSVKKVSEK